MSPAYLTRRPTCRSACPAKPDSCGQFPISSAESHRFLFFIEKTRIVFDQVSPKARACSAERGVLACISDFARKKSYFVVGVVFGSRGRICFT